MSIRTALENKLATITPLLATQLENTLPITTVAGTPYQSAVMLYGGTTDEAITNDWKKEIGIFQVTLFYPTGNGAKTCEDRARLIRDTFVNGMTLSHVNDTVKISKTPDIKVMGNLADRFVIVVSVYWKSYR